MLIPSPYKGIYERILTVRNGELVRVRFAVVEVEGIMRGRVISVTPVVSVSGESPIADTATCASICLPASVFSDLCSTVENLFVRKITSPYVSFDFFMSQPTRAPSL